MSLDAFIALARLDPGAITHAQRTVALVIADTVSEAEGNEFRMSSANVGRRTGLEPGNARRHLAALVRAGVLEELEAATGRRPARYRWILSRRGNAPTERLARHYDAATDRLARRENANARRENAQTERDTSYLSKPVIEPRAREASANGSGPALADPSERDPAGREITKQTIGHGQDETELADPSVFAEARRRLGGVKVPTPKRQP